MIEWTTDKTEKGGVRKTSIEHMYFDVFRNTPNALA